MLQLGHGARWEFVRVAIDDASRIATAFAKAARVRFQRPGIKIGLMVTGNESRCGSEAFGRRCRNLGLE